MRSLAFGNVFKSNLNRLFSRCLCYLITEKNTEKNVKNGREEEEKKFRPEILFSGRGVLVYFLVGSYWSLSGIQFF